MSISPESTHIDSPCVFDISLGLGYPFDAPVVLCETVFSFPAIADGRDLLRNIIKRPWNPSITTPEIIKSLPQFVNQLAESRHKGVDAMEIGDFHLGSPMFLETWDGKAGMACFYSVEIDLTDIKNIYERVLVVTNSLILQLETNLDFPGIGNLISWATLQSIKTIKTSRSEADKMLIEWKELDENTPQSQLFRLPEAKECIALIGNNLQVLGKLLEGEEHDIIAEEEVTAQAIREVNIEEISREIEEAEDKLTQSIDLEAVNRLSSLYQRAIEFYSAVNNPEYDAVLGRMHQLLAKEEVQELLTSNSH